jgi:hypothetical protein
MTQETFSRREFVGIGAAVAGASLIGEPILPGPASLARAMGRTAASDRVRFGMIGIGMQATTARAIHQAADVVAWPAISMTDATCWRARSSGPISP